MSCDLVRDALSPSDSRASSFVDAGRTLTVNARELEAAFERAFDAGPEERRVVARQARDFAASGKPRADRGSPVTVDTVVDNLEDAPEGSWLAERWNWWMGALEVAYGGYRQFQVTAVPGDSRAGDVDPETGDVDPETG